MTTELKEGEFLANIRFSYINDSESLEFGLRKEIDLHLSILPKGTEVVSVTRYDEDMFVNYEVCFRNPLLKAYKEVRLEYDRLAGIVDGKLETFNLLVGIKYIKKTAAQPRAALKRKYR